MVFSNNLLLGVGGQSTGPAPFDPTVIGNSIWLDGTADYLSKTFSSGSAQTRLVFSTWVQRNSFTSTHQQIFTANKTIGSTPTVNSMYFKASTQELEIYMEQTDLATLTYKTTRLFRDIGWYHLILSLDSNVTDSVHLYVNGIRETSLALTTGSALDTAVSAWGNAGLHNLGSYTNTIAYREWLNGYLTQSTMLVGKSIQAGTAAVTDFLDSFAYGTNGSQFAAKKDSDVAALASTAGGNSFCLDFANSSDLGNDISSNNNDFATNGTGSTIAAANQSTNTPSKNYAVMDVLKNDGANTSTMVFSEGNTRVTGTGGSDGGAFSTLPLPTSGTTEFQATFNNGDGVVGICCYDNLEAVSSSSSRNVTGGLGNNYNAAYGYQENGEKVVVLAGGVTRSAQGAALTTNSVVTVRYDAGSNEITFLKDNVVQGSAVSTVAGLTYYAFVARFNNYDITLHFDSADFPHTIGSGNKTINTANLSAPTYQGIDYFTPTLYRGNGEGQRVGDFVPFTDVGTITKSFLSDGGTNTGTTDLRIANSVSTSPTNVQVKTLSVWIKPCSIREQFIYIGNGTSDNSERLYTSSTGAVQYLTRNGGSSPASVTTAGNLVNDTSQWVHLVYALDYRDGTTEADRVKLYVNGIRQTTTGTQPANNMTAQAYINKASTEQIIGTHPDFTTAGNRMDAYLAEMYMVDGTVLDPSTFGVLDTSTNKWLPKSPTTIKAAVTFGNCGFYLDFLDGSDLGDDDSGNNRDFTESATIGTANQFIDTPSQNFATLDTTYALTNTTYSKGNLSLTATNVGSLSPKVPYSLSFAKKSGKWWAEFDTTFGAGTAITYYGIVPTQYIRDGSFKAALSNASLAYGDNLKGLIRAYLVGSTYGNKVFNITIGTGSGTTAFTSGGIINNTGGGYTDLVPYGIALDLDNKKVWIGNPTISATTWNNETSVSPAANTGGFNLEFDEYSMFVSNNEGTSFVNFGQYVGSWNGNSVTDHTSTAGGNFTLAPPTDFKAINQDNLDDTASKLTAWAWIKNRDATDSHVLVDRVRGVGEVLHSNEDAAEATEPNTVQRFLQRGVQVGSDVQVNTANESYVLWQWLLGDSATTGSANTDGSDANTGGNLTSTVITADAGHLAIAKYTGVAGTTSTVGHGLGAEPDLVIIKNRSAGSSNFITFGNNVIGTPSGNSNGNYLLLNTTKGVGAGFGSNPTTITSTTVGLFVQSQAYHNFSGDDFIMWSFRSVAGVCKVGSYTGNGDGATATGYNGPYIELGFKPSFILLKRADAANSWILQDTVRHTLNPVDNYLQAESNSAETATTGNVDFLSSGIKIRTGTGNAWNASGGKYIYLAMADIGGNGTLPPVYGR